MGIPLIVVAGNDQTDACQRTPAGSSYAITVASSTNNDSIYKYTNFGPCVDIFAPGNAIQGADYRCVDCSKELSGASMSASIVSGVAAIHLQRQPLLTPDKLMSKLIDESIKNALNLNDIASDYLRNKTPNRLVHIAGKAS